MEHKQILLIIAHQGFQPVEYGIPKKILETAGYKIVTASNKPGIATGKDGLSTTVDIIIDDVEPRDYAGVFLIGGPGALENLDNPVVHDLIFEALEASIPVGAICIATRILAKIGVLTGRRATGWDGDNTLASIFRQYGVNYIQEPVVVDDIIITATGPTAAREFGEHIVALLQDTNSW